MQELPWSDAPEQTIRSPDELPFHLTGSEERFFASESDRLPFRITQTMVKRIAPVAARGTSNRPDPVRRQFVPTDEELEVRPYELEDPLGESGHSPHPRLIHRYDDRALLLVTDQCAVHCRHCFRSRFTGTGAGGITNSDLESIAAYLQTQDKIREVILSGGDPLTQPDSRLERVFASVRGSRPDVLFRVATRIPIVLPRRITNELVEIFRRNRPIWIVLQINHITELDMSSTSTIRDLVDRGLPVVSQTVLLKGVNDSVQDLASLFTELVTMGVKPYYLFQGDLAPGTAHFRVNLGKALELVGELRATVSGLAMPAFAVDIPGGAGKVPLEPSAIVRANSDGFKLRAPDGTLHDYPNE